MSAAVLDRPIWTTLATRHAAFAVGAGPARRFMADVSPFAVAEDDAPESLAALAALLGTGETVVLLQRDPIRIPDGLVETRRDEGVQMVAAGPVAARPTDAAILPLGAGDVPEMVALATLTEPGPFLLRTHELGDFWGVRIDGRLAAMAGERMKQPGFTEVSGVCTHPDFRGHGLAGALSAHVARRIEARGEIPYLHAYATNAPAVRLYESLGFRTRCSVDVAMLTRP